jgi:hypothetical protein
MSDDVRDIRPYTRHTDETRELAYQLWAFTHGGNCVRVAAALAKMSPPIDVDVRAVQRWAESEQWAVRRADDWRQIAPDLSRQTIIESRYGLLETARMARDMVMNDRTRTTTTVTPNGSVRTEEKPEVSNKERIMAGMLLQKIDTDLRSLAPLSELPPSQDTPPITTPEEALAFLAAYRTRPR